MFNKVYIFSFCLFSAVKKTPGKFLSGSYWFYISYSSTFSSVSASASTSASS